MATDSTTPWHAAYPAPVTTAGFITPADLRRKMSDRKHCAADFLLVDLRRTDHEGGTIRGSLNLPAQTLYHSLPRLYLLAKSAGIGTVIWYCGSSKGRGTRAAGWFADCINENGDAEMHSIVLQGGIKAWAQACPEYVDLMDGYVSEIWTADVS